MAPRAAGIGAYTGTIGANPAEIGPIPGKIGTIPGKIGTISGKIGAISGKIGAPAAGFALIVPVIGACPPALSRRDRPRISESGLGQALDRT